MVKTLKVSEETHQDLKVISAVNGTKTLDEGIQILLNVFKEHEEKCNGK